MTIYLSLPSLSHTLPPTHSLTYHLSNSLSPENSERQSQPRRRARQSHLRQALQRRAIVPPHHRRHPGRPAEDQRELGEEGVGRPGGERTDQEGRGA